MKPKGERNALSAREDSVLQLAARGLTDQQIANELGIRVSTVTTYWIRIRGKLGQLNRAELIALSVRQRSQETLNDLKRLVGDLHAENSDLIKLLTKHRQRADMGFAALDAVPCGVLVMDKDGKVTHANSQARRVLGLNTDLPEDLHTQFQRAGNVRIRRTDGSTVQLQVELKPLPREHGTACLLTCCD